MARERHGDDPVDRYLTHLRIGDPLTDAMTLHFDRMPPGEGNRLVRKVIDRGLESLDDPPPELVALFEQLDPVPRWVDWGEMHHASARILRTGMWTGLAFAAYALPHSYLATANKPLAFTGRLLGDTAPTLRQHRTFRYRVVHARRPAALRGRLQDGRDRARDPTPGRGCRSSGREDGTQAASDRL